jgi:iron(III) transport system substrate-binding protein
MAKLAGEIEAKKVQADVLLVADPAYYLTLKDKGLLMKYDSPMRKDITGNKDTEGLLDRRADQCHRDGL